jgi:hypothetical protein
MSNRIRIRPGRNRLARLVALMLIGPAIAALVAISAPQATAATAFNNSLVADLGLRRVGTNGGECWAFVQNMILQAGGRNISAVAGGNDYFAHLRNAGGAPVGVMSSLSRGDVVQVGRYGGHTFIIVGRVSGNTFTVVDSNHAYDHMVRTYNRTFALDSNTQAFRFGLVWSATPPPAPSPQPARPVFTVMNTSEQPPDGVWFRDEPNTPGPRLNGYGVYMGDRVQLQRYGWGQAIGQYSNRLWYQSANLTRPSAPGRSNVGWLNAHFINDGSNTNVVDAGVPPC